MDAIQQTLSNKVQFESISPERSLAFIPKVKHTTALNFELLFSCGNHYFKYTRFDIESKLDKKFQVGTRDYVFDTFFYGRQVCSTGKFKWVNYGSLGNPFYFFVNSR
jgi:hypothetical protein